MFFRLSVIRPSIVNPEPLLSCEDCGVGIGAAEMTFSSGKWLPCLGVGESQAHVVMSCQ